MFSSLFGPEEKRRDPEDGQFRTFKELQKACAGKYSPQEVKVYWDTQMARMEDVEGQRVLADVASDPFLTHAAQGRAEMTQIAGGKSAGRSGASASMGGAQSMLSGGSRQRGGRGRADDPAPYGSTGYNSQEGGFPGGYGGAGSGEFNPYAAGTYSSEGSNQKLRDEIARRRGKLQEGLVRARRHWTEVFARLVGPGDQDRKVTARNILVLAPWILFMWTMLLWLLLRHYSADAAALLTSFLVIGVGFVLAVGLMGKQFGPVPLTTISILCLLAVAAGTVIGGVGWHAYWRQYWWLQTGTRSANTSAATSAAGVVDAAVLDFWDAKGGHTNAGTFVDNSRSAGYKDKHFYCVAPILSPATAEATLARVNFWAVGLDCCQSVSGFHCDDSRIAEGGHGIVMLDDGFPCPDCNSGHFKRAIEKAEALHGLVSAPGALMVRWVKNPIATELGMLWKAVLFILTCGLLTLAVFAALGTTAWYYGVGKNFDPCAAIASARQKLLA